MAGVILATAMLAGWDPVVERWAILKPAHVWLNLVGSLSLIIVATLGHLAPTVEGTDGSGPRRSRWSGWSGSASGRRVVRSATAWPSTTSPEAERCLALVGALAVPVHALAVRADAATWTTDPGWHRFAIWSLRLGSAWFAVAVAVMAGRVLWLGAAPAGLVPDPRRSPVRHRVGDAGPVGSWSHLLPALGPGRSADRPSGDGSGLGRGATSA